MRKQNDSWVVERQYCYLCQNELDGVKNTDHIIPDGLYFPGDPFRPQLLVHQKCNAKKSKDDQWFIKQLELWCSLNDQAHKHFNNFMDMAIDEKDRKAYLVGQNPRNYVLAKEIFAGSEWHLSIPFNGQQAIKLKISKKNTERFENYLKKLVMGLYSFNIEGFKLSEPDLIVVSYPNAQINGSYDDFIKSAKNFYQISEGSRFGQKWSNRIIYFGSRVKETPDKGFIFLEFYNQLGIGAFFA